MVMAQYRDPRIHYLRHPENIGKSNNMRSGYLAATGEYFIKFDDDDRLTAEFLAQTVAVLEASPEVDFVGTDHWIIDENGERDRAATDENSKFWGRTKLTEGIVENLLTCVFVKQSFQIGATLFRYPALQAVDFMRPDLQNCEDNDLFVRLAIAGKIGYYLPARLMEYRRHPEQNTLSRAVRYLEDKHQYLSNFHFEDAQLESIRQERLQENQLLLGLRLVETGDHQRGRTFLRGQIRHRKAQIGLLLSYLPPVLTRLSFAGLRHLKSTR